MVFLLLAIVAGLLTGLGVAHWRSEPYRVPELRHLWLAVLAFLPQLVAFYLPATRSVFPGRFSALFLVGSQMLFLVFVWLNRHRAGIVILTAGLLLNFAVISTNGGLMPISPQTAAGLVGPAVAQRIQTGERFGTKDILLPPEKTRLEWLADRFLTPGWFPYRTAFSLGDILIAVGAWWLLATANLSQRNKLYANSTRLPGAAPAAHD